MTKTVLITGAGSGLGAAFAQRYANLGSYVVVADVNAVRAEEIRAQICAHGGQAMAVAMDITREEDWEGLFQTLSAQNIQVDTLINNAGVASGGPTLAADIDEWQWMLDVNLLGMVRGCRRFVPDMLVRGHGQIINIASFAGLAGAPGWEVMASRKLPSSPSASRCAPNWSRMGFACQLPAPHSSRHAYWIAFAARRAC